VIVSIGKRKLLEVVPNEHALVVGEFKDDDHFRAALLAQIQQYIDLHFV
jgi:hypothetical protein